MNDDLNDLEDMFREAIGVDAYTDYGLAEMKSIEEEYMDLKMKSNREMTSNHDSTGSNLSIQDKQDIEKNLQKQLKILKKQLKTCRNIKNVNKRDQNKKIAKRRAALKQKIQNVDALLKSFHNDL